MRRYLLDKNVYMSVTQDGAVFLQLLANKYLAISASELQEVYAAAESDDPPATHPSRLVQELADAGVLTMRPDRGKALAAEVTSLPTASLLEADFSPARPVAARDVCNFVYAWLQARIAFRHSFERRVTRIRLLRNRHLLGGNEVRRAHEVVEIFRLLRPFFYTSKEACLFDCYVLLLFCWRYGLLPMWVFGIRTRPFGAHCWLQVDKYAVTGGHEFLRGFTPIMAV